MKILLIDYFGMLMDTVKKANQFDGIIIDVVITAIHSVRVS